jgi:pyruvate dehydrogenase E1 component
MARAILSEKLGARCPVIRPELGGHIASFQSAATLYDVGFNHFWHARTTARRRPHLLPGPLSPGIYARAFLEGRLTEEQLLNFRQEVDGKGCRRIRIRG